MSSMPPPSRPTSQYHHFIPQFLLRNYAHKFVPPTTEGQSKRRGKRRQHEGKYPGDQVANSVDLRAEPMAIEETPVKRILGQTDMYRDATKPTTEEQHRIEDMFGTLESRASVLFRQITRAHGAGDAGLWLTRQERDLLRKFLFLLKYRGSTFHQRFYHDDAEGYSADDKEELHGYMAKHGFARPLDVWFHNLEAIMKLEMDPDGAWMGEILDRMYPGDAAWFIFHAQGMYLAICTPSSAGDEFVLTDNSYNVFEGPLLLVKNKETGALADTEWHAFHEFAPVSPKIMLVLRNQILPAPEDHDPEIRQWREMMRHGPVDDVFVPGINSMLEDLPITKAQNNYTKVVDGRVQPLRGLDGMLREDHKFFFQFFRVETHHVHRINGLLLDNSYACSRIIFRSRQFFLSTLEEYMVEPCEKFKVVGGQDKDQRLKHLEKLAALLKAMGSDKTPVWREALVPDLTADDMFQLQQHAFRGCLEMLVKLIKHKPPTPFMQTYMALGGTFDTLAEDLEQSQRMLQLRIKLDSWSVGVDESIRNRNRELLTAAYLRLPSRRVLLYAKNIRTMTVAHVVKSRQDLLDTFALANDPEDAIARACELIRPDKLNRALYNTVKNALDLTGIPTADVWQKPTMDGLGLQRLFKLKKSALMLPGKIRDCGILEIERLAIAQEAAIVRQQMHRHADLNYPLLSDEDKIEVVLRIMVKRRFDEALAERVDGELLKDLKHVFFCFTYPTPPTIEDP